MSSDSYTPGPWGIAPETNGTELVAYSAGPWKVRAVLARGDFITVNPNWKRDTALWAAAPDLIEALKAMLVVAKVDASFQGAHPHREVVIRMAEAAIAKAEQAHG